MATHKLLLHPADPQSPAVTTEGLEKCLQAIELIGEPVRLKAEIIYPVGEQFLQLITFLGCSPMIELELPSDVESQEAGSRDGRFCHVSLTSSNGDLLFRADEHGTEPRCPQCRKPDPHWRERLNAWREDPQQLHWACTVCDYTGLITDLNFRKYAGFARNFIEIRGVYPSEAIPGEALLASLAALTGCNWNTLYIKE